MSALLACFLLAAADVDATTLAQHLQRLFALDVAPAAITVLEQRSLGSLSPSATWQPKLPALGLRLTAQAEAYEWAGAWESAAAGRTVPLRIRFQMPPLEARLRLVRDCAAQSPLTAEDLKVEYVAWQPRAKAGPALSLASAIGMECRRSLRAGRILRPEDLRPPPLIRSGQLIQARQNTAKAILRFPARSLRHGVAGDTIPIRRPGDFRLLQGRVVAAGEVEVLSPLSPAP